MDAMFLAGFKKGSNIREVTASNMIFGLSQYTEYLSEFLGMDKKVIDDRYWGADKRSWEFGKTVDLNTSEGRKKYYNNPDLLICYVWWHLQAALQPRLELGLRLKGRVLDYGAGIATHSLIAALFKPESKIELYDLDGLVKDFVKFLIKKHDIKNVTYVTQPKPYYDCIVCTDVLEHLDDPLAVLKDFKKWLRRKGKLFLRAPFYITEDPTHKHPDYKIEDLLNKANIKNYEIVEI